MHTIEKKDIVTLAFIGKIDTGDVFQDITSDKPLKVTIGENELPATVELAIIGMKKGESRKVRVAPEEGYGPRLKELLHEIPKRNFSNDLEPKPGMILSQKTEKDGKEHIIPATVIEIKDDCIVIDYNHPMAGHHLTYNLTIIDIQKAG